MRPSRWLDTEFANQPEYIRRREFLLLHRVWGKFGPLSTLPMVGLPKPRAFDRMLCLPTCSFKLVCRPLALPALGVPPNVTMKPKQIMRPNSYNASQGNTTAPMCWSAWFVV